MKHFLSFTILIVAGLSTTVNLPDGCDANQINISTNLQQSIIDDCYTIMYMYYSTSILQYKLPKLLLQNEFSKQYIFNNICNLTPHLIMINDTFKHCLNTVDIFVIVTMVLGMFHDCTISTPLQSTLVFICLHTTIAAQ